ncbi:hypothetical protein RRG08_014940 [Elysia crispata]|uniref:Uncharacterized protein n=1 Tax=Elysia crispata TaxID=231223 RepID=A0AAE1E7X8_9GAST|nr:hypothetical protein RRG08_014940 [Elysia crispata]
MGLQLSVSSLYATLGVVESGVSIQENPCTAGSYGDMGQQDKLSGDNCIDKSISSDLTWLLSSVYRYRKTRVQQEALETWGNKTNLHLRDSKTKSRAPPGSRRDSRQSW